jgi:hypothetical protein
VPLESLALSGSELVVGARGEAAQGGAAFGRRCAPPTPARWGASMLGGDYARVSQQLIIVFAG